jgi:photosystem II stability/assembly factor-like uncharacterized protein
MRVVPGALRDEMSVGDLGQRQHATRQQSEADRVTGLTALAPLGRHKFTGQSVSGCEGCRRCGVECVCPA